MRRKKVKASNEEAFQTCRCNANRPSKTNESSSKTVYAGNAKKRSKNAYANKEAFENGVYVHMRTKKTAYVCAYGK